MMVGAGDISAMKFMIQRVQYASVAVGGEVAGRIDHGYMVLIGVTETDTEDIADKMVRKMIALRIFRDDEGKTNRNLAAVDGSLLLISQFTLYADCHHGNRPSFIHAGSPERAQALYEYIIAKCRETVPNVQCGIFGAEMKVELLNDGPFTILLDSAELGFG